MKSIVVSRFKVTIRGRTYHRNAISEHSLDRVQAVVDNAQSDDLHIEMGPDVPAWEIDRWEWLLN